MNKLEAYDLKKCIWCAVGDDQELIKKHYTSRYALHLYCDQLDKEIQRVGLTNYNLLNQTRDSI